MLQNGWAKHAILGFFIGDILTMQGVFERTFSLLTSYKFIEYQTNWPTPRSFLFICLIDILINSLSPLGSYHNTCYMQTTYWKCIKIPSSTNRNALLSVKNKLYFCKSKNLPVDGQIHVGISVLEGQTNWLKTVFPWHQVHQFSHILVATPQ